MADVPRLKDEYTLAKCCSPSPEDPIIGYYSHDNILKVHLESCPGLSKADQSRLVTLDWSDILMEQPDFSPGPEYNQLDDLDFRILAHHLNYGIDYSLVLARKLGVAKETAFERHQKLRDLGVIERVEPKIVQYRKGVVDNRWIKHRNHTYYAITRRGQLTLEYYLSQLSESGDK